MTNLIIKAALAISLATAVTQSFALQGFSRACRFSQMVTEMSPSLIAPALRFLNLLGMPDKYLQLPAMSPTEQQRHVAFESFTADMGSLRYYLYAETKAYHWATNANYGGGWVSNVAGSSPDYRSGWGSTKIPAGILTDPALQVFVFRRLVFFSVRAGHPEMFQRHGYADPDIPFIVVGNHLYYDSGLQTTGALSSSSAYGCNLSQWGWEDR